LSQAAIQRFYRLHARIYDETRWPFLYGRRRAVAALDLRPDSRVLEVGCGTGLNLRYILEYLDPEAGALVGVDYSPDMLRQAEKRIAARGWQNVALHQADAATLDLGRRFDAILFAFSVAVIPNWSAALERACEHLTPGGRLVVLDFGRFEKWGPFGTLFRWWLRRHHVETLRPYADKVRSLFRCVEVERWLGGYGFLAVAQKLT
jgi:S-adenosylmethionine-diacylgycerolhomoserine-N-methlytransferase